MLRVSWRDGVHVEVNGMSMALDPAKSAGSADYAFISHAHSDHSSAFIDRMRPKYSTHETVALFEAVSSKKVRNVVPCVYDQPIDLHGNELSIINSGHVFGSASLVLNGDGVTLMYTGDFNFTDSLTQKAISPRKCDTLIVESTYGRPDFVFPPREEVYDNIVDWAAKVIMEGKIPFILAYPIGKAQEVTKLFNLYTSIPVVTHPTITRTNSAVNAFGADLNFYDINSDEELLKGRNCVCIFPASLRASSIRQVCPDAEVATVTGWALSFGRRGADASFVLSSHADYSQLMRFVKECAPKQVYTIHGYSEHFASKLKREGICAEPLD